MSRCCFIFAVFLFIQLSISAQKTDYLATYGQVWGFLKYHHPYPSQVNWDKQLLSDYERIKSVSNKKEFDLIIDELLRLCPIPLEKQLPMEKVEYMPFVFDWMNSTILSENQHKQLIQLRNHRTKFENKYATQTRIGNVHFDTEEAYLEERLSSNFRFLAITRYWNAINYFFPYRELIPTDWSLTYLEMIPVFEEADTYENYFLAVLKLSAKIKDGHGFVSPIEQAKATFATASKLAPFYALDLADGTFISKPVNTENYESPLKRGDQILAINGIGVEQRWEQVQQITPHANDYAARRSDYRFKQYNADSINIEILRNNEIMRFNLPTLSESDFQKAYFGNKASISQEEKLSPYEIKKDSISGKYYLLVNMGVIQRSDMDRKFKKLVHKQDFIVFDCRNYPNWTILKWGKYLLKGKRHFAHSGDMSTAYPGSISWFPTQKIGGRKAFKGKVIILVDRTTQSQAEYTVMALQQHPNAITIGGQTAGSDGNVTTIVLPYGIKTTFTGIAIVYPDGTQTQQIGIKRDILERQDHTYLCDIKNDRIMNRALEIIRK